MRLFDALGLSAGDVVALVGGGGKTSLGHALVREAWAGGLRAVFTVTTKIFPPDLPPDQWAAGPALPDGKLSGFSFDAVADLRVRYDLVVVEADGSAGRPLKFPLAHEPVIPPCTTVVLAMAGASVIGRPLAKEWVHRHEAAAAFAGRGGPVTPTLVARILWHAASPGRPAGARVVPVINQADNPERLAVARAVGQALLREGAPLVLLTAAHAKPPVVQRLVAGGI
ncbi:MAG TPA: selenium cofactor biosynthesis protein YqeC [Symbiobacteriaceae bacterium]|nr:selenium cofactor biosynthesis protein YqeC [Symbiobacteriaceae bacterium]